MDFFNAFNFFNASRTCLSDPISVFTRMQAVGIFVSPFGLVGLRSSATLCFSRRTQKDSMLRQTSSSNRLKILCTCGQQELFLGFFAGFSGLFSFWTAFLMHRCVILTKNNLKLCDCN